ncbi:MAG TPA: recombinase family protein [Ktedonobacterales bacterium]|nr:recombinase family protein [Ktedonobacterales bacterium]
MARARIQVVPTPAPADVHIGAYLRVSTDEQADSGLGLADQLYRVNGQAAAKGWLPPTIYEDAGISGTKDASERPALARLLADVRAGRLSAVIVLSLDRLGRNTRLVLDLVDVFTSHGVALVSCKESLDTTTPQGQFVLTMFAALAQLERDVIAQRTKAALDELGRTTGDKGGRIPYGYLRTADGIAIDPTAAAHVKRIYDLHRRGESLRHIASRLAATGTPGPRGGAWAHSGVAEILANRSIYGGAKRGNSAHRWPAILGKKAQALMTPGDAA